MFAQQPHQKQKRVNGTSKDIKVFIGPIAFLLHISCLLFSSCHGRDDMARFSARRSLTGRFQHYYRVCPIF